MIAMPVARRFKQKAEPPDKANLALWNDFDYLPSILNGSSQSAKNGEYVRTIKDLSLNANHATSSSDSYSGIYFRRRVRRYLQLIKDQTSKIKFADHASFAVTGSREVIAYIHPVSWTKGAYQIISSQYYTGLLNHVFYINPTGGLSVYINGVSAGATIDSTANTGFGNHVAKWVRFSYETGTENIKFYTSANGVTWQQLGSTIIGTSPSPSTSTTKGIQLGSVDTATGNTEYIGFYVYKYYSGLSTAGGSLLIDFHATDFTHYQKSSIACRVGRTLDIGLHPIIGKGSIVRILAATPMKYSLGSTVTYNANEVVTCAIYSSAINTSGSRSIVPYGPNNAIDALRTNVLPLFWTNSYGFTGSATKYWSSATYPAISTGPNSLIMQNSGTVLSSSVVFRRNGSEATSAAISNYGSSEPLKYLFYYPAAPSHIELAPVTRMGLWKSAPTRSLVDAWLAA